MNFKTLLILFLILSMSLIGYSYFQDFTQDDAILKAIKYHNTSVEKVSNIDFPIIKSSETVSQEVPIGERPGNKTKLDLSVKVNKEDDIYI